MTLKNKIIRFNFSVILLEVIIALILKGNFYMRDLNKKHNYFFRSGHPLENLYSLSKCDYLLSVRSSFAGWAHFTNETQLLTLDQNGRNTSIEDYKSSGYA